ncbi:MAG: VWA domain-containing protein [Verrucomicrobia bacterium]|nr:VWA domain-containing protein [Verrucomicrobiota bacterium]
MTFAHPYILLLLLLLPVLAWLKGKVGHQSAFLYSSVSLVKPLSGLTRSRAGAILSSLRWLTLALFIVALAQPRLIKGEAKVRASGIDIAVAFDLSTSMAAEDFEVKGERVNRLQIAKQTLEEFIRSRPNDRIGLVAFAGRAYIASPMTLDHDFLLQNLERLRFGLIEDRTAIGSGLVTALNRLKDLQSKSKIVILMTDGVNNAGNVPPLTAAEVAQTLNVKVYTIGIGKQGTAPMPQMMQNGEIATDFFGRKMYQNVPVEIDEETLEKISEMTGGKYYRADNTEALRKIYAEIDQLEKTDVEATKYRQYEELLGWFIAAGLITLMFEIVLGQTIWRKLP